MSETRSRAALVLSGAALLLGLGAFPAAAQVTTTTTAAPTTTTTAAPTTTTTAAPPPTGTFSSASTAAGSAPVWVRSVTPCPRPPTPQLVSAEITIAPQGQPNLAPVQVGTDAIYADVAPNGSWYATIAPPPATPRGATSSYFVRARCVVVDPYSAGQGPTILTYFVRPLRVTSTTPDVVGAAPAAGGTAATSLPTSGPVAGTGSSLLGSSSGTAKAAAIQAATPVAPSYVAQGAVEDPAVAARVNAAIAMAVGSDPDVAVPGGRAIDAAPVSSSRPAGSILPVVALALLAGAAAGAGVRLRVRRNA